MKTNCPRCSDEIDLDDSGVNGVCWRCGVLWQQSGHASKPRALLKREPLVAKESAKRESRSEGRFHDWHGAVVFFGSGEGGGESRLFGTTGSLYSWLVEYLREGMDDDPAWLLDELNDLDNWHSSEDGHPFWWTLQLGECSTIHIVRLTT